MVKVHPNNENITCVGENVRIEAGPKLVTATATEELLHNDRTADHYQVGLRDAKGIPIKLGKEMSYLEWGGGKTEPNITYYIYKKVLVNSTDEFIDDKPNPYFVPNHVKEAASRGERGDDLVAYDYIWEEVTTRKDFNAAVDVAEQIAANEYGNK